MLIDVSSQNALNPRETLDVAQYRCKSANLELMGHVPFVPVALQGAETNPPSAERDRWVVANFRGT